MSKARAVVRDRRRSRKYIHLGKVTVVSPGASWYIYYRDNGGAPRISVGPDRKEAEGRISRHPAFAGRTPLPASAAAAAASAE